MSKLLLDDKPLIVLPSLAGKIGLNESIILQQLHYWLTESKNVRDGEKWVYNTYKEWQQQFPFWSDKTIRRSITKLENDGLIITGNYNKMKIDNTKWYRIDYEKLNLLSRPLGQNDQTKRSKCPDTPGQNDQANNQRIPKNTTETAEVSPFHFYQQNFGVLNPHMAETIGLWIDDLNAELVIEAMKRTLKQQKNFRYCEGILKGWYRNNIRTIDDALAEERQFQAKKEQPKQPVGYGRAIPDEINIDLSAGEDW